MKIITNPDTKYVAEVKYKLKQNNNYCPCKLIKSPDTKCMCKEFRDQESGMCGCGLYIKLED